MKNNATHHVTMPRQVRNPKLHIRCDVNSRDIPSKLLEDFTARDISNKLFYHSSRLDDVTRGPSDLFYHSSRLGDVTREPSELFYHSSRLDDVRMQESNQKQILSVLKPMWIGLRMIGLFPIYKNKQGMWVFKICSFAWLFSLIFHQLMGMYSGAVAHSNYVRAQKAANFNGQIFSTLCILYCSPPSMLPLVNWFEASKVARYLNKWEEFQRLFRDVTGSSYHCTRDKCWVIFFTVMLPTFACFIMNVQYILLKSIEYWETMYYSFTLTLVYYHVAMWCFICRALIEIAEYIAGKLEIEFREPCKMAALLPRYRALWRQLNQLTVATGDTLCYSMGFIVTLWYALLVLALYGGIPESRESELTSREMGLASNGISLLCILFIVCDHAQKAADAVGAGFLSRLYKLSSTDSATEYKLEVFCNEVFANKPIISLGSYVVVNRALLTSLLSATVTYLVVLVQFKMSEPVTSQTNMTSSTANQTRQ